MLNVAVTRTGEGLLQVKVLAAEEGGTETGSEEPEDLGPNPIAPEAKELIWGGAAFLVLLVLMRLWLFPRLKKGMDARAAKIRGDLESADSVRAAAQTDVEQYEAALTDVRAEATRRLEAVRQQLEAERAGRLAEVNARIADRRAVAAAGAEAAREAARGEVEGAAAEVAAAIASRALGEPVNPQDWREVVADVARTGVTR